MEHDRVEQDKADGSGGDGGYRHADPVVDAALNWFVTLLDGSADAETLAAYHAWRQSDPRHAQAFDRLAEINGMPELRAATRAGAPQPVPLHHPAARSAPRGPWWGSLAAAVVLAAIGLHLFPAMTLRWTADHRTAAGERREVALPDGSRLTLDTDSAVALDFGDGRRTVRLLRGQGYFDVVPDPARPFRVIGGYSTVQVTGTAFAVHADDGQDAVVLERGRVSVSRLDDPDRSVNLVPGDRVTATAAGLSGVARADPATALAWREGRYVFHEQPFAAVVDTLRRYHPGTILLLDERVGRERVSGNYRLDDAVGALQSLAGIVGARVTTLPAGIVVVR
ncbi:FecR family protein [Azospirillum sp.]|uniref:FecR family protein n=1 Tax=Azospirillum sp. TaxID=34012 RepID=UPI002D3768C5|nr:FecR family protein [Azospirillum sp.]HYD67937.1 FecR family protein [Azospirillum sp.]